MCEGGREALSEPTACSLDFFKPWRMVCNFENGPKSFEAKRQDNKYSLEKTKINNWD